MFKNFSLIATLVLSLTACSQGVTFVAGDGQTAFNIANSSNVGATVSATAVDPNGAKCFGGMQPAIAALQAGKDIGMLTMIEVARVAILQSKHGGTCGALAAPVLSQLALVPGASNALAIAAVSVQ